MREDGMKKLMGAFVLLFIMSVLQSKVFAADMNCKVKELAIAGIESLQLTADQLIINNTHAIQLEKLHVTCAHMGSQLRFEGEGQGLQVILRTCSTEAKVEGHIIDPANNATALVLCDEAI
jgi:hypothetical protein